MEEEKIFQEIELCSSTMGAMCRLLPSTPLDKSRHRERKLKTSFLCKLKFKDYNNELCFFFR
jgi:hypothetical protein